MKPIQVVLLAAVAAVAGGLFVKWQVSPATAPPPLVATAPAAPAISAPQVAPASPPAAEPPAPAPPAKPRVVSEKPRRLRARRPVETDSIARNATPEPEKTLAVTMPAAPVEQPAPPMPAPLRVPAEEPAAATPAPAPAPLPPPPQSVTLAAGTLIQARTIEGLSTDRNQTGDTFTATLDQPLVADGFVIAERGARLEGRVVQSDRAGRVKGVSELAIELTLLHTSDRQRVAVQTETFTKRGDTSKGEDAAKVGAVAAIGAAIGAIAGGGKGAGIGAAAGGAAGAGGVMSTRGKAAEIRPETRISFRLRNAITITERQSAGR